MPDLETRLREYAVRLDLRFPDIEIDELVHRELTRDSRTPF